MSTITPTRARLRRVALDHGRLPAGALLLALGLWAAVVHLGGTGTVTGATLAVVVCLPVGAALLACWAADHQAVDQ